METVFVGARRFIAALKYLIMKVVELGNGSHFRFIDHRLNYNLFVQTTREKPVIADRVAEEFAKILPALRRLALELSNAGMRSDRIRPELIKRDPAFSKRVLRMLDAGGGDGTLHTLVKEAAHDDILLRHIPHYLVIKEISVEDVRLELSKMPDRLFEHPATMYVITNLPYSHMSRLQLPADSPKNLMWKEIALTGDTAHKYRNQLQNGDAQSFLDENWGTTVSQRNGNLIPVQPSVIVIYRQDHLWLRNQLIPKDRRMIPADYDLVIAAQPYRARSPLDIKARTVIAPLAEALAPGGRLIGIHSQGDDAGHEIIREVWPEEQPFIHTGRDILNAVKRELTARRDKLSFDVDELDFGEDNEEEHLYYNLHLSSSDTIGTSAVHAAWNDATYVAQIDDKRIRKAERWGENIQATRKILNKYNGNIQFRDSVYVIARSLANANQLAIS